MPQSPTLMDWLPTLSDFRGNLRAALAISDSGNRLEKLANIAQHRLGFLETIQLDQAVSRLGALEIPGFSAVRLAILASSTVDHLVPAIRVACLRRGLVVDVRMASRDRKSTRLNSSHGYISYAVFCLKKKK